MRGALDKGVLYDLTRRHVRRERNHTWGGASGHWAGVANSEIGQCVALVARSGQIVALNYGMDVPHTYQTSQPELATHGRYEMVSYLVVPPDVAQARLYRWLEHTQWPKP